MIEAVERVLPKLTLKEERKILVGNHTFYLDRDNILYITIVGEIDDKKTNIILDAFTKLQGMVKGKVNIFVNINNAGKLSIKTRTLPTKLHMNKKIGKIAIFGLTPVAKVIAAFFMGNSKTKGMKFFNTKEKAIEWLTMPTDKFKEIVYYKRNLGTARLSDNAQSYYS
ncbi:MAG: STAS/SEC14 domain-containing protein [bacterium]|nr:STAS/SEC14 domain-containing protein [bacterium]